MPPNEKEDDCHDEGRHRGPGGDPVGGALHPRRLVPLQDPLAPPVAPVPDHHVDYQGGGVQGCRDQEALHAPGLRVDIGLFSSEKCEQCQAADVRSAGVRFDTDLVDNSWKCGQDRKGDHCQEDCVVRHTRHGIEMADESSLEDSFDSEQTEDEQAEESVGIVDPDHTDAAETAKDDSDEDGREEDDGTEAGAVADHHIHLGWNRDTA